MFKPQKSNLGKSIETFESSVGATQRGEGDLISNQSRRIDGIVNGDIYQAEGAKATVAIAPGATVSGNISVQDVIVSGTLKGNIRSSGRVELIQTAAVEGDIHYGSIGIAVGARIVGQLNQIDEQAQNDAASAIKKAAKLAQPDA